jgi:hypothetical protein
LQKQIKWIEDHSRGNTGNGNIKQLKAELAELIEQEAKADALRRLPLYSCRVSGWKFVCSKCYDKVYMYADLLHRKRHALTKSNLTITDGRIGNRGAKAVIKPTDSVQSTEQHQPTANEALRI